LPKKKVNSEKETARKVPVKAVEPWQEPETTVVKGLALSGVGGELSAVDVKNGKIVRIRPLHFDSKYTKEEINPWKIEARGKTFEAPMKSAHTYFAAAYKKRVYSPNRIKYPLKRVDWEPGGDPAKTNPHNRGKSKFKRISWKEAVDLITSEIKRIQGKYGPYAIYDSQGRCHGETKTVHAAHMCNNLLLQHMGGCTTQAMNPHSWEGWWWGAKHVWGDGNGGLSSPGYGITSPIGCVLDDVSKNTNMIIWWGCDFETTGNHFGQFKSPIGFWFTDLGIKQVFITPDVNYSVGIHADKWIPILPNTDAALQLAVAYTWIKEGIYDKEYVATHVVGFEQFKAYVMGEEDGVPKTPEWASKRCGVTEWIIKALARQMASQITSIGHQTGGGMIRGMYSHETTRLECILLGMMGLGKPGVHQIYYLSFAPPRQVVAPETMRGGHKMPMPPEESQFLPDMLMSKAIDNPPVSWYGLGPYGIMAPAEYQFVKKTYPLPKEEGGTEIHLYWTDTPCLTTCTADGFSKMEALRNPKIECVIAQHPWLENDCLLADIILPISTKMELEDVTGCHNFGLTFLALAYEKPAIKPIGESMSDYEAVGEIAKKFGKYEEYTAGKNVDEWLQNVYEHSGIKEKVTFEEFKEKGYYIPPTAPDWKDDPVGMQEFYQDPENNPLSTPSGKLEFYSQRLAENFPDDKERPPVPKYIIGGPGWTHDESLWGKRCKKYPLLMVANPPRWRSHSNGDDISWFREIPTCRVKGYDGYMYQPVWINPLDAEARNIKDGDIVKVYNDRGIVLAGAKVWERVMPGAVSQDHGARVDPITRGIDRGGAINLITPTNTISKNASGMAVSGFLVEIEKVSPTEMDEWRTKYPEAFKRDYDPAYGPVLSSWVEGGMG
jgi:anaerobic selenocysteine-containing dehydrogenase